MDESTIENSIAPSHSSSHPPAIPIPSPLPSSSSSSSSSASRHELDVSLAVASDANGITESRDSILTTESDAQWDETGRLVTDLLSDGGSRSFFHRFGTRGFQAVLILSGLLWLIATAGAGNDSGDRPSQWQLISPAESEARKGDHKPSMLAHSPPNPHSNPTIDWHRLAQLNRTWCHYPAKRSAFQFDEERYHADYMPLGESCSTLESKSSSSPSDSSLSFEAQVDAMGILTVTGCINGSLWYTTEYDRGGPGVDGGWRGPSVEARRPLGPAPVKKKMDFPASFVFIGCDATQSGQQAPKHKFITVHTPVPNEILKNRPKPSRTRTSMNNDGSEAGSNDQRAEVSHRNIIILQLDAVSTSQLPVIMPRTYALLEGMRVRSDSGTSRKSSSFQPPLPSVENYESYRFAKNSLTGANSPPNFFSLYGNGDWDHIPPPDSSDWMWVAAQEAGYRTGFGEDNCACSKYRLAGIAAETLNASRHMDFNAMFTSCALPDFVFSAWEKQYHVRRCFQGRGAWRYLWDMMRMAIEQPSETATDIDSDSLEHPLFFLFNFLAAHELSGVLGRHFDDDLFADELAQLLALPAMRDNGMVLVFSDHGLHYGDYSMASAWGSEEHMDPFLYLLAPRNGKGALNRRERETLQANQKKLTNPYDWYRTLMSLIREKPSREASSTVAATSPNKSPDSSSTEQRDHASHAPLPASYNLLRELVPFDRSCTQLRIPFDSSWSGARKLSNEWCLCESPFSILCQPRPADVSTRLWQECTEIWAHPLIFDAEFYARVHGEQIASEDKFRRVQKYGNAQSEEQDDTVESETSSFSPSDSSPFSSSSPVSPCRALHHWCTVGAYRGLQSSPTFHVSALAYYHPKHTQNSQNILAWAREFIAWGHNLQSPPLRTLYADAASGRAYASEQLFKQCPTRTTGDVEGSRVWFRAVATGTWCPEVTMDAAASSKLPDPYASPLAWTTSLKPLSDEDFPKLLRSAVFQCNHWCMFDVESKQVRGWEVRAPGCLLPFVDNGQDSTGNGDNKEPVQKSLCVTAYAALREQVLKEIESK